jgi:hypothetical protein
MKDKYRWEKIKRVSTVQKIEKNTIFLEGNGTSKKNYGSAHIELGYHGTFFSRLAISI